MDVLKRKIPYERVAEALDELVKARDPRTVQYMADRYAGRPAQALTISGDVERPIHVLAGVGVRQLGQQPQLSEPEAYLIEANEPALLDTDGETPLGDGALRDGDTE